MNSTSRKAGALLPYGLTAVGLLAAGQVSAQSFLQQDWSIPVLPDQLYEETVDGGPQIGAVTLSLDGEVGTSYQTNIYGGPSSTAVSSLIFEASPRATVRINTGRLTGRVQAGADYTQYLADSANDQLDMFVRANLEYQASDQLTIRTAASVVRNEIGIATNSSTPELTPTETRSELRTNVEIGADYQGARYGVSGTIGVDVFNNSGLQQTGVAALPIDNSLRDRTRVYGNVEISNTLASGDEVFGGINGAVTTYANQGPDPKRDSFEIAPYVGMRRESSDGTMVAEGQAGLLYRDFAEDGYGTILAPTLDASLTWQPIGGTTSVSASTSTSLEDSMTTGQGATFVQDFEVAATFQPLDQFELTGGLAGAYSIATKNDGLGGDRSSDFMLRPSVDARYFVSDEFYVGANAYYEQKFGGGDSENDLGIGLSAGLSY